MGFKSCQDTNRTQPFTTITLQSSHCMPPTPAIRYIARHVTKRIKRWALLTEKRTIVR